MAEIEIVIPGHHSAIGGSTPVAVLGPGGSGKTKLAQRMTSHSNVTSIGAQRRTWVDDSLPDQDEMSLLLVMLLVSSFATSGLLLLRYYLV